MKIEKRLTEEQVDEIRKVIQHFPLKSAGCIEGLKLVQKHHRWVDDQAIKELAEILEMSPDAVDSVATYYNLIFRRPVGRHVIFICDSVSCWIMGNEKIIDCIKKKLAVGFGETTPEDRFTLLTIQCLGTCDHAPAMIVDEDLHQDVTSENLDLILENYK